MYSTVYLRKYYTNFRSIRIEQSNGNIVPHNGTHHSHTFISLTNAYIKPHPWIMFMIAEYHSAVLGELSRKWESPADTQHFLMKYYLESKSLTSSWSKGVTGRRLRICSNLPSKVFLPPQSRTKFELLCVRSRLFNHWVPSSPQLHPFAHVWLPSRDPGRFAALQPCPWVSPRKLPGWHSITGEYFFSA